MKRCKCGLLLTEINIPERWIINGEWKTFRQIYTACPNCAPGAYSHLIERGKIAAPDYELALQAIAGMATEGHDAAQIAALCIAIARSTLEVKS